MNLTVVCSASRFAAARPERAWPWWQANCSRRLERNVQELAGCFLVFETLGQDAQGQRLYLSDSFGLVGGIAEHSREIGNLGDPPAILLAFELNLEGHMGTLAPERRPNKRLHPLGAPS